MLLIGTLKGLFRVEKRNRKWEIDFLGFGGQSVYTIAKSKNKLWATPFSEWAGAKIVWSVNGGSLWNLTPEPLTFPKDTGVTLENVWQFTSDSRGRLFCGVQPAALFISDDDGETWELCRGLWNHPHREKWEPGFGGLGLHTILPISEKVWVVAVSTGGVYRTEDAGETWNACNHQIIAPFLREKMPDFGQCVHKIAADPTNSSLMMLQHHWGVYRSTNAGKNWENVGENKLPSDFGFACVMNASKTAFVIPIKADSERIFPEGKMRVYRTEDAGETWKPLSKGLPQKNVYDCVLRDNFHADKSDLAFGTTGGKVYFSSDNGDSWEIAAEHLPRISCVRVING